MKWCGWERERIGASKVPEASSLSVGMMVMCLSEVHETEDKESGEQIMHLNLEVLNCIDV